MQCRLLIDPPARGDWNMAVDEMLLERAGQGSGICLRLYRWSEPTLSLGYFQAAAERARHPASAACALVRRASGGGAILHDRELTYSIVVPTAHPLAKDAEQLYIAIHQTLVETLKQFGIAATVNRQALQHAPADEPFLCFQRRAVGDLLVDGWKIAGSAQRRSRGAILQHGSILMARSRSAPELDGLAEIAGFEIPASSFETGWLETLSRDLQLAWEPSELAPREVDHARTLVANKFGHESWTLRR